MATVLYTIIAIRLDPNIHSLPYPLNSIYMARLEPLAPFFAPRGGATI
jgi:hypothetical protein